MFNGDLKFATLNLGLKKRKSQTELWKCEQSGLHLFQYYCEWHHQGLCFVRTRGWQTREYTQISAHHVDCEQPSNWFPMSSLFMIFSLITVRSRALTRSGDTSGCVPRPVAFCYSCERSSVTVTGHGMDNRGSIPGSSCIESDSIIHPCSRTLFRGYGGDKMVGTWTWPRTF
jgi:hypothetical protein